MHYDNEFVIKNSLLQIVIYKNGICGVENKYEYEIVSIQKCQFIPLNLLIVLSYTLQYKYKDILDTLKEENYYILEFSLGSDYELVYRNYTLVTVEMLQKSPELGLH